MLHLIFDLVHVYFLLKFQSVLLEFVFHPQLLLQSGSRETSMRQCLSSVSSVVLAVPGYLESGLSRRCVLR